MKSIPSGWQAVRLGDVADACLGKMLDAQKNRGQPLLYLRNPNVRWFDVDTTDLREMPFEDRELERYGLRAGDVVICEGGEAGRAAIWDGRIANVKFQKAIHRVRTGPDLFNRFLVYHIKADYHSGVLADYYTGATIKHLTGQDLAKYVVVMPPLSDQRRIADILDRAEALRAKRRAALGLLDGLTHAIFLEMFGDPRRAGSSGAVNTIPRKLGELVRIRTGKLDVNAEERDGIYPFFTCAIDPVRINTAAYDCKAVLVAGNGTLNVKYYEGKFNAYQRTYVIESANEDKLVPRFLYAFMDLYVSELRRQSIGGVIKYIKLPYLTDAVINLPVAAEQSRFANKMIAVEDLKTVHRASLAQLDALFASLQHRAFRGEL